MTLRTNPGSRTTLVLVVVLGLLWAAWPARAAEEDRTPPAGPFHNIHVIDFKDDIEAVMHAYITRRVDAAIADGADCIVLRFDSPGGTVYHSKKIGDFMLALPEKVHTIAWVPVEAISGAAMISLACREIVMAPGSSLGDSQPIVSGADGMPKPIGEKIESPLRTWFREYAQRNGYPEALVEAMVSAHIEVLRVRARGSEQTWFVRGSDFRDADEDAELVPGHRKGDLEQVGSSVVREGELLTMTATEALDLGFIHRRFDGGLARDEQALLGVLRAPDAKVTFTEMSFSERASKWLLGLAGILSALVALAIVLFIWQGPGLMTIIGGIALLLVVFINLTADQMNGFPLFLILVGMALLAIEVFVLPGFGIPGFLGVAALAFGLLLLATGRGFEDVGTLDTSTLVDFALQFLLTVLACFGTVFVLSRFFPRIGPARRMILAPAGGGPTPATVEGSDLQVGSVGVSRSPLRPAGSVEFDGRLVDVTSDGGFVEAGRHVRAVRVEGTHVMVTPVEDPS